MSQHMAAGTRFPPVASFAPTRATRRRLGVVGASVAKACRRFRTTARRASRVISLPRCVHAPHGCNSTTRACRREAPRSRPRGVRAHAARPTRLRRMARTKKAAYWLPPLYDLGSRTAADGGSRLEEQAHLLCGRSRSKAVASDSDSNSDSDSDPDYRPGDSDVGHGMGYVQQTLHRGASARPPVLQIEKSVKTTHLQLI